MINSKIAFVLILCMIYNTAKSQNRTKTKNRQTRNFVDKNGYTQGFWKISIPDASGRTRDYSEGIYYNGKEVGVWVKKTHENIIYQERIFFDTLRHKVQVNEYYLNGHLESTGFLYSIPYSDTVYVYDEKTKSDTKPIVIESKLVRRGKWTFYYSNGNIESEGIFEDDNKKGKWNYYKENGEVLKIEDN